MAKKAEQSPIDKASEPMAPEAQMEALDKLPETKATGAPPSGFSKATPPSTVIGVLCNLAPGHVRVVLPAFDPLFKRGRPGGTTSKNGYKFVMDHNGDLIGDVGQALADAWLRKGEAMLLEDHTNPAKPRPADEIERAQAHGNVLLAR